MDTPIACNLNAFSPDQAVQHRALWERIHPAVQSVKELPDGYGFELASPYLIGAVAEWVLLERLCCPFLHFGLRLTPHEGLFLELTGREGVKEFLRQELGQAL